VAWTILYILLGLSLALILHARGARGRGVALLFFVAQLLINYAWSPVFFGMNQATTALVLIVAMLVLSAVAALLFGKIRKAAGLLMLPYLAWLCFATFLNYQIVQLNPDADTLVPQPGSADIAL
jgi:tryptophan-rich sensory protein